METGDEYLIIKSEIGVQHKKDHTKISQFTKFEVLSLGCNHVQGRSKIGKIGDCMEFGGPLTGHSLVITQCSKTKLGKLTNFNVISLARRPFISSYDAIGALCKLGHILFMNFGTGN